ncbi:ATP-binding cassette domain-containing protein [Sinomonas sp. G460-2]|uniref:ATP-binding cassette domain-containing protein n=1 Tax=Sinomonas sp. G460-2 TaxID=3393464 RepID=UPI0039EEE2D5
MPTAISLRGLTKSFGDQTVLDGLDLDVERGEIFALLGPNGAGKTTLVSILTTLVEPDGGQATVGGLDVVREKREVTSRISLTGQNAAVDEILTGEENLRMMGRLWGLSPAETAERTRELLDRFDLVDAARKRVKTYSGGMRRRLDLALGLLRTPPIVFLDEPTTGLDTRSRQELWDVIRSLAAGGTTVFLTTQYLEEADQLADRVAVLDGGRIVALGTAAELKSRVGGMVLALHDASGDLTHEQPVDGTLAGLRDALAGLPVDAPSVTLRAPSLDDVFLAVTGSRRANDFASRP